MVRRLTFCLFIVFYFSGRIYAQTTPPLEEEKRFIYKKEWSGGVIIHSRGFGGTLRHGIVTNNFRKIIFETDLVKIKHPKEIKVVNPFFDNAKSYVYGKKNAFFALRVGAGSQFLLFDKAPQDGVEINFHVMGGASLGLLKPIYLEILKETNNAFIFDVVTEKYDELRHFPGNIYGYSGFNKGLNELTLKPGGYLKTGLSFDWSTKDNKILALETGTVLDLYPKQIPIMADFPNVNNKSVFISFYANITFGKKY